MRTRQQRVERQQPRHHGEGQLGQPHHAPAVVRVGERPAQEGKEEDWNKLGQTEQSDRQR